MKKKLLSLAFAAALLPAFNAYGATDPGLTQKWCTPFLEIGDWNGAAADWNSTDAIKNAPCARFATARGGKIYTVNMKTMSIAEVTSDGLNDLYKLDPSLGSQPMVNLADGTAVPQIYGTAISLDDAGNFLIGRNFVTPVRSTGRYIHQHQKRPLIFLLSPCPTVGLSAVSIVSAECSVILHARLCSSSLLHKAITRKKYV